MNNELVSIIVPIYNVEKYLDSCIDSIINQTYSNLEVILVDDGSPDNCPNICDEWKIKDSRIKVIHKKNGGLSDARNEGLKNSTGKFVCFVDSDDYIDKSFVEKLLSCIIENDVKISQCNYIKFNDDSNSLDKIIGNYGTSIDSNKLIEQITLGDSKNTVTWNKMYSKELFNNIKFPKGKIHEDEFTTYKLFSLVDKVGQVEDCLYYYRQTDNSIMHQKFNVKRLDYLTALEERIEFFKTYNKNFYINTLKNYLEINRNYLIFTKKFITNSNNYQSTINKNFNKYLKEFNNIKNISRKEKIKIKLIKTSPTLYYYAKRINNLVKKLNEEKSIYLHIIQNYIVSKTNSNLIFLLGVPSHGNLGDQAIVLGEEEFIKDNLKKYKLINIESKEVINYYNIYRNIIGNSTILYTGGGFLGSLWETEEDMFRTILRLFKNNKIVALPQTFFFSNDENGKRILKESQKIYSAHNNLHLFCREEYSYDFMKNNFKTCNIYLTPDMVLYLDRIKDERKRNDILFCIRKDKEKVNYDYENIKKILKENNYCNYDYTDTVIPKKIFGKKKRVYVYNKIKQFSKYKLIITDRLHGMIFALLANTPCIVLENKSYKIKGVYKWIERCNYIKLTNDLNIERNIEELLSLKEKKYNSIKNEYSLLKKVIEGSK